MRADWTSTSTAMREASLLLVGNDKARAQDQYNAAGPRRSVIGVARRLPGCRLGWYGYPQSYLSQPHRNDAVDSVLQGASSRNHACLAVRALRI